MADGATVMVGSLGRTAPNAQAAAADAASAFVHLRGRDLWLRAAFDNAALLGDVVQLAWTDADEPGNAPGTAPGTAPALAAGLAFDSHCRLYHSLPEAGSVERLHWARFDPLDLTQAQAQPLPLFAPPAAAQGGDFHSTAAATPLRSPRGLAVDVDDLLYVADAGARAVWVLDLLARTLVRRLALAGQPLALAAHGRELWLICAAPVALYRLRARGTLLAQPLPAAASAPSRIAVGPGGRVILLNAGGTASAALVDLGRPGDASGPASAASPATPPQPVPWATDLAFLGVDDNAAPLLVVARRPGETFLRLALTPEGITDAGALGARGYDGRGICATPDLRILYWTAQGLRHAVAARQRYRAAGRIVGCRLDGGEFQRSWGRIFIDACLPRDSTLALHCIVSDDDDLPDDQRLPRSPPDNLPDVALPHAALSPPLPDAAQVPPLAAATGSATPRADPHQVRRINGSELPWLPRDAADTFATYEATGTEQRGRYLWLVLVLGGNTRVTPRVRALRVECPAHDLLRRLPQVLWRETESESFLQRFLAPLAGLLGELDARALLRRALLDPAATPPEAVDWLAGFVGLAFDPRWPLAVRRRLIAEAMPLFRQRGTVAGLGRFIAIVTGVDPVIIEHFRLRGGAVVGNAAPGGSRAIVGAGLRVGGQVSELRQTPLNAAGTAAAAADAFATHAHRFTVMLPALLGADTLALADDVLARHRPAHTAVTVCSAGAGMRLGRGLHIGLTSVVGRSSGWQVLQLGAVALGREAHLGWPRPGIAPAATRLGIDSRAG